MFLKVMQQLQMLLNSFFEFEIFKKRQLVLILFGITLWLLFFWTLQFPVLSKVSTVRVFY